MEDRVQASVALLRRAYERLGRLPKKTDFEPPQVCLIKQTLGPWPRALERAGLKQVNKISSKEKSRLKRERIKNNKKRTANED